MNIFVCVKQVPDTENQVQPNGDGTFIETSSIKWIMNPYDEFAVEQALLTKAANAGSTVTVVRVGGVKDTEALRTAMAMGADDSILVEAEDLKVNEIVEILYPLFDKVRTNRSPLIVEVKTKRISSHSKGDDTRDQKVILELKSRDWFEILNK